MDYRGGSRYYFFSNIVIVLTLLPSLRHALTNLWDVHWILIRKIETNFSALLNTLAYHLAFWRERCVFAKFTELRIRLLLWHLFIRRNAVQVYFWKTCKSLGTFFAKRYHLLLHENLSFPLLLYPISIMFCSDLQKQKMWVKNKMLKPFLIDEENKLKSFYRSRPPAARKNQFNPNLNSVI